MQTVYVDTLLCVNLFIDYIILCCVRKLLRIHAKHLRILIASVFSAVAVLAVFLPFYNTPISLIYRPLTAFLTVLIAFGKADIKRLFIRTLSFFGASMIICGAVILVVLTLDPSGVAVYNDTVYFDISPITLLICTAVSYLVLSVYERIKNAHRLGCTLKRVTVYTSDNEHITFDSAVDTGCDLKEPFSQLPVIVVEKDIIDLSGKDERSLRVIPFETMSGNGMIYGFKPDKLLIDGKEIKEGCYIGVCENKLKGETRSIMGTELTEEL